MLEYTTKIEEVSYNGDSDVPEISGYGYRVEVTQQIQNI